MALGFVILWRCESKSNEETSKSKGKTSKSKGKSSESKEKSSKSKEKTSKSKEKSSKSKEKSSKSKEKSSKSKEKILEELRRNPMAAISELMSLVKLSRSGVEKIIRQLKECGKIRRVGPDRGGHWEICE